MSTWTIELVQGRSELAHDEAKGLVVNSVRPLIEDAERRANASGRTLVFVNLWSNGGMNYYYPLQLLPRLSEYPRPTACPGCGFRLWKDPGYRQKRKPLLNDSQVDYVDGTMPL